MAGFSTKTFAVYDDYMTPKSAWEAVAEYIPKDKVIWEPFYGDGKSGEYLRELGFQVIHAPEDFFETDRGHIVVSNPPFSLKKEVIDRLVEIDKPFMLIMSSATLLCSYVRDKIGSEVQIIIPRRRIQFAKLKDGKTGAEGKCNFDCFYFCYKWGLPRDIIYLK